MFFQLKKNNKNDAQTLLEYLILIGIVTTAIVTMGPVVRRGIHSTIKITADQIGQQNLAEQSYDELSGHLINSFTTTRKNKDTVLVERDGGITEMQYGDRLESETDTLINLGFTERAE